MSITQQYLLDSYRARVRGEAEPPAPGRHDLELVRELIEYRRFRAVVAERPARGRVRSAMHRWLRPRAL
ncbi:hypothetical protein ACIHEJ_31630 [Streptomyces sp. NPDC052301]|uniref:hypothetical protein n=1 Tax=Streptomyces sp. NPDC052301 TaxID=3365687 RepID=UPI0037D31A12